MEAADAVGLEIPLVGQRTTAEGVRQRTMLVTPPENVAMLYRPRRSRACGWLAMLSGTITGPKRTPASIWLGPAVARSVALEAAPVSIILINRLPEGSAVVAYNFAPLTPVPQVPVKLKSTVKPRAPPWNRSPFPRYSCSVGGVAVGAGAVGIPALDAASRVAGADECPIVSDVNRLEVRAGGKVHRAVGFSNHQAGGGVRRRRQSAACIDADWDGRRHPKTQGFRR